MNISEMKEVLIPLYLRFESEPNVDLVKKFSINMRKFEA